MNYDDSSLAWNWVTYKAERDYITFTNTTDPAAELLAAGKLLTESQAQVALHTRVWCSQGDYDGRGQQSCNCNYVHFYKEARPPCSHSLGCDWLADLAKAVVGLF